MLARAMDIPASADFTSSEHHLFATTSHDVDGEANAAVTSTELNSPDFTAVEPALSVSQHLTQSSPIHAVPPPLQTQFPTEEEARNYTNQWVREHGYAVTIRRRKNDRHKLHETIYLKCERGGKYGERSKTADLRERKRRNTGTRLCDCPFRVVLRQRKDHWMIDPQDLTHNHDPSDAVAQPANRRQDMKKVAHLIAMHMTAGLTPAQSLTAIQQEFNYTLAITPRDMWNERNNIRRNRRAASLTADTTITGMDEHFLLFKDEDEAQQTTRVAFVHKQAVERLLPHYSEILCIDTLRKNSQSAFPVTNLIGVTAENEPFILASALMSQDVNGYAWFLRCLLKIYQQLNMASPTMVITGFDRALQHAVKEILPDAHHMLCLRNAEQEIRTYAKNFFTRQTAHQTTQPDEYHSDDEEFQDTTGSTGTDSLVASATAEVSKMSGDFADRVSALLNSTTEEAYQESWENIKQVYSFAPGLLLYVRRKWLSHRESLVVAWTDRFRNYGLRSIPNIEAYHRIIKRQVPQQVTLWTDTKDLVLPYFQRRLQELIGKIETEKSILRPEWAGQLFSQCRSVVSTYALTQVRERMSLFGLVPSDTSTAVTQSTLMVDLAPCTGHHTSVTGLPCEHIIQQRLYLRSSLKPSDFDSHWHLSTKRVMVDYRQLATTNNQSPEQPQQIAHFLPPETDFKPQLPSHVHSRSLPAVDPSLVASANSSDESVNQALNAMAASFHSSLETSRPQTLSGTTAVTPPRPGQAFNNAIPTVSGDRQSPVDTGTIRGTPRSGHQNDPNSNFSVCPVM